MPGIDINKKSTNSMLTESVNSNSNVGSINKAISISPTKKAFMNAFANSLSRSLSMGSFSYKSLGKSLSQMSYGRSPLFDIYQQFKQSVPKNSLPPCIEEEDEMVQDIESNFCKDFTCCGIVLKDLHELLQHFEDAHRMESDMEEEDDLPFEFDDLSSSRNNSNENYLPTLTDLFLKDLEAKQRHMNEDNLLSNGMGIQNQPIQQSIAMSDIYSEDKKDPATTLDGNTTATFSDILNNKNATAGNLSRTNSTSSLTSKLNNPMTLNIPNTTTTTSSNKLSTTNATTHITTPSSATTSNFNLSKNISAFNNAVSGNLFNQSNSSNDQQTPTLTHTTLATTSSTTSAATTATASAALASGFQAVNNLKNFQKIATTNKTASIQPAPVTTATGMHTLFPNTSVNPFALLNASGLKGAKSPFNLLNAGAKDQQKSNQQKEFDDMDMDMDMDDANDMMNGNDPMLMAEAGPDEEKKYRCTVPGCNKSYKNPGGLKYHLQHGHFEDTGDPEMNRIMHKPFQCTYENCGKRYKNMNGLKYHIEHSHTSLFYNQQQGGIGLTGANQSSVPLDSQQVLAFQALQMQQQQIQQQLQQLQHIN
ncbi:hypothetical protein BCR32DRAFT_292291 [Anaeromyces robustus]|uniref:C2H2-type domain-containing protein n=1 Tax=Anaeromyces robustus TaxID=1754192 RepID=A0A1Y1XB47_9FUNG|nr:hypothetical protein BCR32DRAFT_292291 [Anaeromyces robustus]|eukprot:ORX82982.1 hypothetical protein BCR32DRAFT_292291 [Anaeromyces robustus]